MLRRKRLKLTQNIDEGHRRFYLKNEVTQARIGIILFAIPLAAFAFNDYLFFKLSIEFFALAMLRIALLLVSGFVFIYVGRLENYRTYDNTITLTTFAIIFGGGIINASRPSNFIIQAIVTGLAVFVIYLVIPNRFSYKVLLSSTMTIGEAIIIFVFLKPTDVASIFTLFLSLVLANAIGFFSARNILSHQIDSYSNFMRCQGTKKALEEHTQDLQKIVMGSERLAIVGATASMVGHDIRSPLMAMMGEIYLAKKNLKKLPENNFKLTIENNLDQISRQITYVSNIAEDIQDFTKELKPTYEVTDFKALVTSVISILRVPQNVTVETSIESSILNFKTDRTFLQRIITNLSNNAIQAMPNGGKLTIKAIQKNSRVMISIQDMGEGIPEEMKAKLFTPLFTTKLSGHGFGLASAKRMTEALGGEISFESIAGKGTVFTVELPQFTTAEN